MHSACICETLTPWGLECRHVNMRHLPFSTRFFFISLPAIASPTIHPRKMQLIKVFNGISILCALLATAAATPAPFPAPAADDPSSEISLKSRNELTDKVANVDVYSGGTCGGSVQQVKQVNGGAQCYVLGGQSIDVSSKYADPYLESPIFPLHIFLTSRSHLFLFDSLANEKRGSGCSTSAWAGTKCQGSSVGVPNASCFSVVFASVLVNCGNIKAGGS